MDPPSVYRSLSTKVVPKITFRSDTKCVKSQDGFLDNQNNKAHLSADLSLLSS